MMTIIDLISQSPLCVTASKIAVITTVLLLLYRTWNDKSILCMMYQRLRWTIIVAYYQMFRTSFVRLNSQYGLVACKSSFNSNSDDWCVDSGASIHLCSRKSMFTKIDYDADVIIISGVSWNTIKSHGMGQCKIPVRDNVTGEIVNLVLDNVYYVPNQPHNLISVKRLLDKYKRAESPDFKHHKWRFMKYIFNIDWIHNMYRLTPVTENDMNEHDIKAINLKATQIESIESEYICDTISMSAEALKTYSMMYSETGSFDVNIFDKNNTQYDNFNSEWSNNSYFGVTPLNIKIIQRTLEKAQTDFSPDNGSTYLLVVPYLPKSSYWFYAKYYELIDVIPKHSNKTFTVHKDDWNKFSHLLPVSEGVTPVPPKT